MEIKRHPDYAGEKKRLDYILGYLRAYEKIIVGQRDVIDASVSYSLEHYNDDNPEQFNELSINLNRQEFLHQKTRDVSKALLKPYFARVDFSETVGGDGNGSSVGGGNTVGDDGSGGSGGRSGGGSVGGGNTVGGDGNGGSGGGGAIRKLYIGKMTLFNSDGIEMLIVDWRAPVSTLYYEGRIGEASYECPDGTIRGEISLKRQYIIDNAELREIMDIDITTNDAFLQAALGSSKDNRLRDIVTTIQAEQNRIIRADMFSPLIVQGAAGGGKTTIALHRVAYLLYAFEKSVKPKNIMIIAPSKFFLSYISGVLPELGVENVVQTTYEDFAMGVIGCRFRIKPAIQSLAKIIDASARDDTSLRYDAPARDDTSSRYDTSSRDDASARDDTPAREGGAQEGEWVAAARIKSSLEFYGLIERYYKWIEKSVLPKTSFVVEGYEIITRDAIAGMFFTDYAYLPLSVRLREMKKSFSNTLNREKKLIIAYINAEYEEMHNDIVRQMPDGATRRRKIIELLAERDVLLEKFTNKCKTAIAAYLKQFNIHSAITYYTGLIGNTKLMNYLAKDLLTPDECAAVARQTMSDLADGFIASEDLAPLMFLQYKLHGLEERLEIKHIVIDEAQDFSLFQFNVLRLILGTGSFSILGDLHQGIYSFKGVQKWEDLYEPAGRRGVTIFKKPQLMTLEQSYRTTVEIMDMANIVIRNLALPGIPLAKPVIRHGSPVEVYCMDSFAAIASAISNKIDEFAAHGHKSIAIICKTGIEARRLKELLPSGIQLVTGAEDSFEQGVKIFPSYHVKGLEFDAVCIANASDGQYHSELDVKLLYIAMTRALHALAVYSLGRLSGFLQPGV